MRQQITRDGAGVPLAVQSRLGSNGIFFKADQEFGKEGEPKRLLTVDAPRLWGDNVISPAEAWCVTLSTDILEGFDALNNQIVPLRARITASAGGTQHFFDVDVHPSVIVPVFAPSVTVDVFWSKIEQNETGNPFQLPRKTRVRATAHQANLNGQGTVSALQHTRAAGTVRSVLVPPFVDRFAIRGSQIAEAYDAATLIQVGTGDLSGGGLPLLEMTGDQMLTVVQDGRWVDLPGRSGLVVVNLVAVETKPWWIEFGMKF